MENYGNDLFLYWKADCRHNEGRKETFDFIPGQLKYLRLVEGTKLANTFFFCF